jgi:hypothetical protein
LVNARVGVEDGQVGLCAKLREKGEAIQFKDDPAKLLVSGRVHFDLRTPEAGKESSGSWKTYRGPVAPKCLAYGE